MNWIVNGHNIFEIVLVTFLVSAFLVPLTKKIANHVGALDLWSVFTRLYSLWRCNHPNAIYFNWFISYYFSWFYR